MLPALLVLCGGAIAVLAYASLLERNWFAVRRHRIPCLPPGARPLRVLHLSDLHLRAGQRRKRRFVARAADLGADLAVGTGDFLGDDRSWEAAVEAVGAIRPPLGGLFVLGSNDYYGARLKNPLRYFRRHAPGPYRGGRPLSSWPSLVAGLEGAGWRLVNNRALRLEGIEVVGLDDPHILRHDLSVATPRAHEGFRLGVAHSPDVAPDLARLGYDLILCGHTHGGQVRVPGIGALVSNSSLPPRFARGAHRIGEAWLHVCAGLGTSMYAPVRFACRPELCLLDLVPRDEAAVGR